MTDDLRDCGDCGAKPGERHDPGCDVEQCALCGGQLIGCGCVYEVNGIGRSDMEATHPEIYRDGPTEEMWERYDAEVAKIGGPIVWTGTWPGEAECIEFGLYAKWVEGSGWVRCSKEDPGAEPDLNRMNAWHYNWSREKRRWVPYTSTGEQAAEESISLQKPPAERLPPAVPVMEPPSRSVVLSVVEAVLRDNGLVEYAATIGAVVTDVNRLSADVNQLSAKVAGLRALLAKAHPYLRAWRWAPKALREKIEAAIGLPQKTENP